MQSKKRIMMIAGSIFLGGLGLAMLASCGASDTKTVSFETYEGSKIDSIVVDWGQEFKESDIPETTRKGYTLEHWYYDEEKTKVFTSQIVESDFTLYAGWQVNYYTVNYYDHDGVTKLDEQLTAYNSEITLPKKTKDNYTFAGWYTTNTFDEASKVSDHSRMPDHDINLYANFTANYYDVNFNSNDGDSGRMDSVRLTYGGSQTLPTNTFEKTGYTFTGWNTKKDGSGTAYSDGATIENIPTSGLLTLYAQWSVNSYTVSFYNDSVKKDGLDITLNYGQSFLFSELDQEKYVATNTGFNFKGWGTLKEYQEDELDAKNNYFVVNGNNFNAISLANAKERLLNHETLYVVEKLNDKYTVTGNAKIIALFERKQNTISFDVDGGLPLDDIVAYYDEPIVLQNAAKVGCTFDGWSIVGDESDDRFTATTMPAESVALKANWNTNSYQLNYVTNNNQSINSKSVPYGELITLPDNLEKTGYTFAGWYYDAEFINKVEIEDTMPNENVTLYAKWEEGNVNLTINIYLEESSNLGSFTFTNAELYSEYKTGDEVDLSELINALISSKYQHRHVVGEFGKVSIPATGYSTNVNLELDRYNVTFVRNDGDKPVASEPLSIAYGIKIPSSSNIDNFVKKTGYTPTYTYNEENHNSYTDFTVTSAMEIEVSYEANNFALTVYANGDGAKFESNNKSSLTISDFAYGTIFDSIERPVRTGYDFEGWYFDAEGTQQAITMDDTHVEIFAKWTAHSHTITFDSKGGSEVASITQDYGTAITAPEDPTKEGYLFKGWSSVIPSKMPDEDLTLEAIWEELTITVFFDGNTANEGEMNSKEYKYHDENKSLTLNAYSKVGYSFIEWRDGNGKVYADGYTFTSNDFDEENKQITLYAQWSINSYTITLNTNGGDELDAIKAIYGETLTTPTPVRKHFKFAGWYSDEGLTKAYTFSTMPAENFTLYAKWETKPLIFMAEDDILYRVPVYSSSVNFMDYIEQTYAEFKAYDFMYNALDGAINEKTTKEITELVVLGNLYSQLPNEAGIQLIAIYRNVNGNQEQFVAYIVNNWKFSEVTANEWYANAAAGDQTMQAIGLFITLNGDVDTFKAVAGEAAYNAIKDIFNNLPLAENTEFYAAVKALNDTPTVDSLNALSKQFDVAINLRIKNIALFMCYVGSIQNGDAFTLISQIAAIKTLQGAVRSDKQAALRQGISVLVMVDGDEASFVALAGQDAYNSLKSSLLNLLPYNKYKTLYQAFAAFSAVDAVNEDSSTYNAASSAFSSAVSDAMVSTIEENVETFSKYQKGENDVLVFTNLFNSNVLGGKQTVSDEFAAKLYSTIDSIVSKLSIEEFANAYFLTAVVPVNSDLIYDATNAVSLPRSQKEQEFIYYEQNAYNPPSKYENTYFDGWIETEDSKSVTMTASYLYKLPTVSGYMESHTSSTVDFTWNGVTRNNKPDTNVYAYRIVITKNDVAGSPSEILAFDEKYYDAETNKVTYSVDGLSEGDKVQISVEALFKKGVGYAENSTPFEAYSIVDGRKITVEAERIASDVSSYTYINKETASIDWSEVSDGAYYYINKKDAKLYLFCSGNYTFSNISSITIIGESDLLTIEDIKGDKVIHVSSKTGELDLNLDGTPYHVYIYPYFDHLELGTSYKAYISTTLTSKITLDQSEGQYLSANSELDTFKVGKALTTIAPTSTVYQYSDYQYVDSSDKENVKYYYNGVKLDFIAKSDTGATINNANFEYDITITNGEYTLAEGTDYIYDRNNFVIYFIDNANYSGICKIAVSPKLTNNIHVPKAILEAWDSDPDNLDTISFSVEVNNGFNAYSNDSLRAAYADVTLDTINIMNNIKANYTSKMVGYVDYIVANTGFGRNLVLHDDEYGDHGEVDIVDGTAYMAYDVDYVGCKYRKVDATYTDAYIFSAFYLEDDNYTIGYFTYDAQGAYYIHHGAEWKQNATTGHFKIINDNESSDVKAAYEAIGLECANIYSRTGLAQTEITVNGNYFTIDASDLPYIYSTNHVTAGSYEADYQIQSVVSAIFNNQCYDPDASIGDRRALEDNYQTINAIYYALPLANYSELWGAFGAYVAGPSSETLTALNDVIDGLLAGSNSSAIQLQVLTSLKGQLPDAISTQAIAIYIQVNGNQEMFVQNIMMGLSVDETTANTYYALAQTGYQSLATIALYAQVNGDRDAFIKTVANQTGADLGRNLARSTFYNLTVYGNTSNISKFSTGTESGIKKEMEEKSGGINGFAARQDTYFADQNTRENKPADPADSATEGYANVYADAEIYLYSVNVYDTLIGLYPDTYLAGDYVRVDNSWANGVFSWGGHTDSRISLRHSYIGSSGGAAFDIEDNSFIYNPSADVDYSTVVFENMITGEEPWFKGYNMEVLALKLKGQFEQLVAGITSNETMQNTLSAYGVTGKTYTILQQGTTSSGRETEEMNFVALGKCSKFESNELGYANVTDLVKDNYPDSNFIVVALDADMKSAIGLNVNEDYIFLFDLANEHSYFYCKMHQGGIGVIYIMLEIF